LLLAPSFDHQVTLLYFTWAPSICHLHP